MKYYNNGFYDVPKEGRVEITDDRYKALLYGQAMKELTIKSDAEGYPQLYNSAGELFDGDVYTYDHTAEAAYIEAARVRGVQDQIFALSSQLASTDYKVVKNNEYIAAGVEPYYNVAELYAEREAIRVQIRELEGQL